MILIASSKGRDRYLRLLSRAILRISKAPLKPWAAKQVDDNKPVPKEWK